MVYSNLFSHWLRVTLKEVNFSGCLACEKALGDTDAGS